jgi:hypothetical protein
MAPDLLGLPAHPEREATDPTGVMASKPVEAEEDKVVTQKPNSLRHPPHLPPSLRHQSHRADQYLNPIKSKNIIIAEKYLTYISFARLGYIIDHQFHLCDFIYKLIVFSACN